jgi:hypothetical protein
MTVQGVVDEKRRRGAENAEEGRKTLPLCGLGRSAAISSSMRDHGVMGEEGPRHLRQLSHLYLLTQ